MGIKLDRGATPLARKIFFRHIQRTEREAVAKETLRRAKQRIEDEEKLK